MHCPEGQEHEVPQEHLHPGAACSRERESAAGIVGKARKSGRIRRVGVERTHFWMVSLVKDCGYVFCCNLLVRNSL